PATFHEYMGGLDAADVTFQLSVDFDEKPSGAREVIFETGGGTFGFSIAYEAGNRIVLRASGNDGRYVSVIERTLRDEEIAAGSVQLTWAYDTMNLDGTQSIGLWVNGAIVSEVAKDLGGDWSGGGDANLGEESTSEGSLAGNGLNGNLIATDFVSGSIDLGEGLQMFHSRYPVVGAIGRKDSDGDGMSDYAENLYGLDRDGDDAGLDLDGDTLSNIDEINNGTMPNQVDSDADGLADNVETHTGTWMSPADTGTDPSDPDSDDDGLLDGVENPDLAYDSGNAARQPGSDPNVQDSDGDSVDDGLEIQLGSDPSNQGSTSSSLLVDLVSYWPLDVDLEDAVDDNHGTKRGPGAMPFVEGKLGGAVEMDGYDQYIEITGGDESEFDFAGGSMSISSWFKVDKFDTNWQAVVAKGEGQAWRLHRHSSGSQITFSGGANSPSAGPVVNDGQWHHAVAVSDAGMEQRLYVDGKLVSTASISPLANGDKRVRIGDNPDTENREWEGCIDEVAIWGRALTEEEIATLWNEGEGRSIFGAVDEPLRIARVGFTDTEPVGLVEIAWVSTDSHVYAVERSFDLLNWEELDDNVEATGEFTTYVDQDLGEVLPQRAYYRVLRME
ncbi:MAG: LamG domain-containing protein, partial [Verrucomicrobiales bacterium]